MKETDIVRSLAALAQTVRLAVNLERGEQLTTERDELRRVWDAGIERLDSATGVPFSSCQASTCTLAMRRPRASSSTVSD